MVDNHNVKIMLTTDNQLVVTVLTSGHMSMIETTTVASLFRKDVDELKKIVSILDATTESPKEDENPF